MRTGSRLTRTPVRRRGFVTYTQSLSHAITEDGFESKDSKET